jgi:hypothetical protein
MTSTTRDGSGHHSPHSEQAVTPPDESDDEILSAALTSTDGIVSGEISVVLNDESEGESTEGCACNSAPEGVVGVGVSDDDSALASCAPSASMESEFMGDEA